MSEFVPVTVAIPTYQRDQVLLETLEYLLCLTVRANEIIVVDQTPTHTREAEARLHDLAATGSVRWLRLSRPSIPAAMNRALVAASEDIVLFLDDDIRPEAGLLEAHFKAHNDRTAMLVTGRVIQPWQEGLSFSPDGGFHFASTQPAFVKEFMGGNFSVDREIAIAIGGFDENFVRVAYRFEAEFAHRYLASGRRIYFEPRACLHHLKVGAGGTRTYGNHLSTWRPDHAVGAYYYGLRTGGSREFVSRPLRAIVTRYHLRHPWRIPATVLAELTGMIWAVGLFLRGHRRLQAPTAKDSS